VKRLQAAIFDFDGLILDTETALYEAWSQVYAAHGVTLSLDLWASNIGGYAYDAFHPLDHLQALLGVPIDQETINAARRACYLHRVNRMEALPGVRHAIDELRSRKIKCAVASSSSTAWVTGHLERLHLLPCFEAIACGDQVEAIKPDPDVYQRVLEKLAVSPGNACAFEDSPKGVAAARAASLYCVAISNSVTQRLDLGAAQLYFTSFEEVAFPRLLSQIEDALACAI